VVAGHPVGVGHDRAVHRVQRLDDSDPRERPLDLLAKAVGVGDGYINSGRFDGAGIIGGNRVGDKGYFVAPTILTGTRADMKAVQEEIFGPVVAAAPFNAERDILPTANNSDFGLGAGVFTRDVAKAYRTARKLRAGTVWVNTWNVFDATMPFGGYKESGWGREMGHEVFKNYMETKTVITDLS
jgi:phenylacetaldehyde dehydrogenase